MTTGQRILYEQAEVWTSEWAAEIRKYRNNDSIEGLLIFSKARAQTIMEMLEAIQTLKAAELPR